MGNAFKLKMTRKPQLYIARPKLSKKYMTFGKFGYSKADPQNGSIRVAQIVANLRRNFAPKPDSYILPTACDQRAPTTTNK